MNKERKIALLVDVDNVKISKKTMDELLEKLNEQGEVVYCKFYGYNDRKHLYLTDFINNYGYETAPFMRFKKRFSQLDNRIIVDAVRINYTKPDINTFCIVAGDGDLIPLLVELKSCGKVCIDVNTDYQEINQHLFDEHIELATIDSKVEAYAPKTKKEVAKKVEKLAIKKVEKPTIKKVEKPVEKKVEIKPQPKQIQEEEFDLSAVLRDITYRYNQLDFTTNTNMKDKLELINDIEDLIESENNKGEGIYSANEDMRQIFRDLQDIVDDIKNAL